MTAARLRILRRRLLGPAIVALALLVPTAASAADQIFWTNAGAGTVMTAGVDGSGAHPLYTGQAYPQGVGLDPTNGKIYWADSEDGTIRAGNIDGSGTATVLYSGQGDPRGIDVDPAAGKVYWSDNVSGLIEVGNLDGSGTPTTLYSGQAGAWGVAVDPAQGLIYWAMTGSSVIRVGHLDGSGTPTVVWGGEERPAGIAIDPSTQELYWGAGSNIRRGKADGSGSVIDLYTSQPTPIGFALDPSDGTLFWADYTSDLRTGLLSGGGAITLIGGQSTPTMPALLRAPQPEGAPQISGGARVGEQMHCSAGRWGGDVPGAFLYRASTGSAVKWLKGGVAIAGATEPVYTPTEPGPYSCEVTLSNQAGSSTQASASHTVLGPLSECPEREISAGAGTATPVQLLCSHSPTSYEIVAGPTHGSIANFDAVAGTLDYTAAAGYSGDDSFTYRAVNAGGTSLTATVEIGVPAPPRCRDLAAAAAEDRALPIQLVCDSEGSFSYVVVSGPAHGSLSLVDPATGTLEYDPAQGYVGDDSFTYRATNISGDSAVATVRVRVHAPPVCRDLARTTPQGQPLPLRLDCADADADAGAVTFAIVTAPAHGTLTDFDPATGAVTYTPDAGFSGEDDFIYRATGDGGESGAAIARVTVLPATTAATNQGGGAAPNPPAPQSPPTPPSNVFKLGRATLDRRHGTARLAVAVPGPGTLALSGGQVRAKKLHASGGTVVLQVAARGKAAKALRARGKARVKVTIAFTPDGGTAAATSKALVLRRAHR